MKLGRSDRLKVVERRLELIACESPSSPAEPAQILGRSLGTTHFDVKNATVEWRLLKLGALPALRTWCLARPSQTQSASWQEDCWPSVRRSWPGKSLRYRDLNSWKLAGIK